MSKKRSKNQSQAFDSSQMRRSYDPMMDDDDEISIDFVELFSLIRKKFVVLVVLTILFAAAAGFGTNFFLPKQYSSSGTMFLTPLITESGTADYSSLSSNSKLVNNVMTLLTQNNIMTKVAELSGVDSASVVRNALHVTNVKDTEVIVVSATTTDPKLSKSIAKNTIDVFIEKMQQNLNVKNIEIVDTPRLTYRPVGPNLAKNTMFGAVVGFGLGCLYIFFLLLTDNTLKNKDAAERYIGIPVLCEIPEIK